MIRALLDLPEEKARRYRRTLKALTLVLAVPGYLYIGAVVSLIPLIPIGLGLAMQKGDNPHYPALNPFVIGIWFLLSAALFIGFLRSISPNLEERRLPLRMLLTPVESRSLLVAAHQLPPAKWRRVHHVLVHAECDAWVMRGRRVRRDLMGNCLFLGLPLLHVLSPEQLLTLMARALFPLPSAGRTNGGKSSPLYGEKFPTGALCLPAPSHRMPVCFGRCVQHSREPPNMRPIGAPPGS